MGDKNMHFTNAVVVSGDAMFDLSGLEDASYVFVSCNFEASGSNEVSVVFEDAFANSSD